MPYRPLISWHPALAGGLTVTLCALWAPNAAASGALELTGAPTSANGLLSRSLGRHAETAYFNPALLPRTGPLIEASYFVLHTHGDISLDPRPAGADVAASVYDAEVRNLDGSTSRLELRPLATADLPNPRRGTRVRETASYALVGITRPLFEDAISFGLFAILPTRGVLSQDGFFADEREQFFSNQLHFEMLGDRNGVTSFALALGGRLWPWISLGVGANLALSTTTRFEVYVPDAADQRTILLNPDMTTSASFAPYLGLALQPSNELTMTATLHASVSSDVSGENLLRFWNYTYPDDDDFVRQTYLFSQAYQPLRAGIGAAWEHGEEWRLGAQAVLRRWSQYRDRHGERPADTFDNTIDLAVGGAIQTRQGLVSLDLGYAPSPVPDQIGRSNYVDNDRLATLAGFEIPLRMFGSETGVGVYLHGELLMRRQVTKRTDAPHPVLDEFPDAATNFATGESLQEAGGIQTNNPGYPGFASSGWLLGAGLAFRLPR